MKKTYFAPVAKTIDLNCENAMLLTVSGTDSGEGGDWGNSNRREENYSSPIWDNEI